MSLVGESNNESYQTLASEEWLEWNRLTWGLTPIRVSYGDDFTLSGVIYVDRRGRVRQPPLNPYLPFRFASSGAQKPERITRQWEELASLFAKELSERTLIGHVSLPPGLLDCRPFRWAGLLSEFNYTYTSVLPHSLGLAAPSVRKNINKANRAGYYFEDSAKPAEIVDCLESTSGRKGFDYRLRTKDLEQLQDLIGSARYRTHVVRDTDGSAVSAGARLLTSGGTALDWIQGTQFDALKQGAAQLMYGGVLDDLTAHGATRFDYGGANIKPVAVAKASWGMQLTPYLTLGQADTRHLLKTLRSTMKRALLRR